MSLWSDRLILPVGSKVGRATSRFYDDGDLKAPFTTNLLISDTVSSLVIPYESPLRLFRLAILCTFNEHESRVPTGATALD